MKQRHRIALVVILTAITMLFAAEDARTQRQIVHAALPGGQPRPDDDPAGETKQDKHRHYDQRKHPTTLDPARFVTTRTSRVVLPLPEERDAFCFVVFGDRTGGPAEGIRVLEQAVHDTNLIEPDLVMTVGDLVQGYNQTKEWLQQMHEYKGVMGNLLCPWFPVAGNHDVYWRGTNRPEGEHESNYEMHFGPLWYAFEHKDCWFIALYSDEGDPETGEKNFNKPTAQRVSPEQFTWLEDTLKKAEKAQHVFAFLHHPRWLGGGYGDDWQRVHKMLTRAGNVRIVFAGHIHHMRYDGPRDGIEYVTLATVGGAQSFSVPQAGFLHQYHIVTVRDDQIAIASIPVGQTMDVRALKGQVVVDAVRLSQVRPAFETIPRIGDDGRTDAPVKIKLTNPIEQPVEVTLLIDSKDARWYGAPDHLHTVLVPGQSSTFRFELGRVGQSFDQGYRQVDLVMQMDYLGEEIRVPIPESRTEIPLRLDLPAPPVPSTERALTFDGNDCLAVSNAMLNMPDGPLTLECWFNARSYNDRTGLINKTESSEYGFFVNKGIPEFDVFLGQSYAIAKINRPVLKIGKWHHIAGVFDGKEVRLYVDGKLLSAVKRGGRRRTNTLPLLVGADVNKDGVAVSHFDGMIDAVRLSTTARYHGDSFTPKRRLEADRNTVLMLNMDGLVGPWLHDASPVAAHAELRGDPQLVEVRE